MFITDIATQLSSAFTGTFSTTTEYIVGGYYEPGDGGGGTFVWITPTTLPSNDDGIVIYNANDSTGCFMRVYSGAINVRWFGAIMGANTGSGTISDVTIYVHKARDSEYTKNGSIYFPADFDPATGAIRAYAGAFEFTSAQGETSIFGDGKGSVLMSNGTGPMLTLGTHAVDDWRLPKVSNLQILGDDGTGSLVDGILFGGEGGPADNKDAGRWVIENVFFIYCDKAVHKPTGNIGNSFINCTWENNEYA